jgi:hypothetical protein
MQSAEYYRQKAAELREEAAAASIPRIKDQLKRIANQYEILAGDLKKLDRAARARLRLPQAGY